MFKVIEIIDSDDDNTDTNENNGIERTRVYTTKTPPLAVHPIELQNATTETAVKGGNKNRSRNRRKSVLQPMRTSPDIQFETIALDDDEECTSSQQTTDADALSDITTQQFKSLTKVPSNVLELLQTTRENLLKDDETVGLMREIAEERTRLNFMMAALGLPKINFVLYENISNQIKPYKEQLKRSRIMENTANELSETKKHVKLENSSS